MKISEIYPESIDKVALEVITILHKARFQAYFAGGCVRDLLIGTVPKDYDIATDASPGDIEKLFAKTILVGAHFGVAKVVYKGKEIEITSFRKETGYSDGRHPDAVEMTDAAEDVKRRDFTINGLLYDVEHNEVLDFVGGIDDLRDEIIRTIGNPNERFGEDKLRMMRAVRFAARFDFHIHPDTQQAIMAKAYEITAVSAERIADELKKMLLHPTRADALVLLVEMGLLKHILPEVDRLKKIEHGPYYHPEGDALTHTVLCLKHLQSNPTWELVMATLLHDIGKYETYQEDPNTGRIRFINHAKVGAALAETICRRLKLSNKQIRKIVWLVSKHLFLVNASEMRLSKLKRIFTHEDFEDLAELHRVDALGSSSGLEHYYYFMNLKKELSQEELQPPPLITGYDLIELRIPKGPAYRQILEDVRDRQLQKQILSKEEALAYIKEVYADYLGKEPTD